MKGVNTGRWLLIGWMAYHVVLSFYHSVFGLAMHVLFLGALALILFSAQVTKYFRRTPA